MLDIALANTTGHSIKIGGYGTNTDINGMIADVRVWDHARSSSQIQSQMNLRLTGAEAGLLGYWKLDEGAGSTAYDLTANGSDGSLIGATWTASDLELLPEFAIANPLTGSFKYTNTNEVDVLAFPQHEDGTHYQITEGGTAPDPAPGAWTSTNPPPATILFTTPAADTNIVLTAWFTNINASVSLQSNVAYIVYTTSAPVASVKSPLLRSIVPGQTTLRLTYQDTDNGGVPLDDGTTGGEYNGMPIPLLTPVVSCPEDTTPAEPYVTLTTAGVYQVTLTVTNEAGNVDMAVSEVTLVERTQPDLYVSLNGSNAGGLDWASAYTTIQAAMDDAAAGDTIHVAGGQTFELGASLVWPAGVDGLTLRGGYEAAPGSEPGANDPDQWPTTLTPEFGVNVRLLTLSSVADATLENLTFRNGRERAVNRGGAVYANAVNGLFVKNCLFLRNNVIIGSAGGGALAAVGSSGMITNSVFIGNFAAETTGHGTGARGGAFYLNGGAWTLRDLHVNGNFTAAGSGSYRGSNFDMAGAISLGGASGIFDAKNLLVANSDGGGIRVDSGTATFENLTVSGCDPVGLSIQSAAAANTTIRNSILYGNRADLSGSPAILEYNIIGDGSGAGLNGNLADDPEFNFPLFYLTDNSPALNSGTGTVAEAELTGTTVLAGGVADSGTVSRGYHFPDGVVWDLDLYVAAGGTGDGSSPASQLGSITAALAQAAPRTRIHIAAGTYANATETFPLSFAGKTIQLLGADAETTIIDATGSGQRVVFADHTPFGDNRIEKVTLRGGVTAEGGGGTAVDNATLTVTDAIIRNNRATVPGYTTQLAGGGLRAIDATLLIDGVKFLDNLAANSAGHIDATGGGLQAYTAVTMRLYNSIFRGNITRRSGGTSYSLYHGGGVWLGSGNFLLRNLLLENNIGGGVYAAASSSLSNGSPSSGITVMENLTSVTNNAVGIQVHATAAPRTTIRNSIAYGNYVADMYGTLPATLEYNCIGDGTQDGIDNNFAADPLFVDAAGGDFRLSTDPLSPCINTGLNQPWMIGATDLQGFPRIMAGQVDRGAYESLPPAGTLILVR